MLLPPLRLRLRLSAWPLRLLLPPLLRLKRLPLRPLPLRPLVSQKKPA